MQTPQEQPKRALVLSGGGGRGAYHIGVLEYLERVGWHPDLIIGSSVGAVNAMTLGSGVSVRGLKSRWLDLDSADVQLMSTGDVLVDNLLRHRDHIFDLTVGLMTHYQLEHHKQLFELGWWDAFNDLAPVLPLRDKI